MVTSPSPTPLVLVSGSGRSGTSSLAGTLKRLGLHVPQPEVAASETNQRGFYEPRWVIDFHKRHLKDVGVTNIDTRPAAVDLVAEYASSGAPLTELVAWLADQLDPDQVVVKDPHAFWFADVWDAAARETGADLRWLTAMRHPAEVVGSRDIAYRTGQPDEVRLRKETSNVAGWVHAALLTERAGRGHKRAFIRYVDLLADWRTALTPVRHHLDLRFDVDLAADTHHEVDDFLEPSMRKSQLTWDDVHTPDWLRDMAEEVWHLLGTLVADPTDTQTSARLDEIHDDYVRHYADAVALTLDHSRAAAVAARRQVRQTQRETVQRLRGRLAEERTREIGGREAARALRRAMLRRLNLR